MDQELEELRAKIAPLVAENERLRGQVLTDAERRCIESWKRDELIWLDQEKRLKAELTALKAKLEVAVKALERIAVIDKDECISTYEGRTAREAKARIEELGRKA